MTTRAQYILAKSLDWFYEELGKLSTTPDEITDYSAAQGSIKLYNHVRETDERMQLQVANAFAKTKWKNIYVEIVDHEWVDYPGDVTTLINSIFRGLARNTFVKEFSWEPTEDDLPVLPVTIPSLPPNLRGLYLWNLDLREDVTNNRRGLPELIQQHKNLKMLHMNKCQVNPKAFGMALSCNGSVECLSLLRCRNPMEEFFDSVNNSTLQRFGMWFCSNALGISGLEAMQRALKEKRLAPQKLILNRGCFGKNEVHAVTTMQEDDTTITELDLSWNELGDDGVAKITSSLRNNAGLRDLTLEWLGGCTAKSYQVIKDFVKSRPDGTLDRVHFSLYNHDLANRRTKEEIDTLLAINKVKPFVDDDIQLSHSTVLSLLQHNRLDCINYFLRERLQVITSCVEESTESEESTGPSL